VDVTVSPARGSRSQRATTSTFAEPTTVIRGADVTAIERTCD